MLAVISLNNYPFFIESVKDKADFGLGTLYGTEHPWFWRIHITAIVFLGEGRHFENMNWLWNRLKYNDNY